MKLTSQTDTIVALATPPGEGGLSVIRVSGPESLRIASRGFQGKAALSDALTHTAHFGRFVGRDGSLLDEVVAVVFRGPHSYTGEDTVELSCHGGILVSKRMIEAIVGYGARLASPGEFTKRAFLNGKLDLSQAEAVADLIHSKSEAAHRSSLAQLEGALSSRVQKLRNQLLEAVSLFELELDFAEEGYEFTNKPEVKQNLA
ncbi:MAG: tRNA uridine-5-carboxymethylaminomethyl(34) synthesis GTPase MnmE, partial [Bacteroidota bacterium]